MIKEYTTLAHVKWECKYHIVITPKYRKRILYHQVKERLKEILHMLAKQKESKIIEGHLCNDHIHMVITIPPKYSVSMLIGFIKGKSAIKLHNEFARRFRNYYGKHFWSRGYYVSTVGLDEEKVRQYVKGQEKKDREIDGDQRDMGW